MIEDPLRVNIPAGVVSCGPPDCFCYNPAACPSQQFRSRHGARHLLSIFP